MMKETKEILTAVAKFAIATDKAIVAQQGGAGVLKIITEFIPAVMALPVAIKDAQKCLDEIKGATEADKREVAESFKKDLDGIPQENVHVWVDQAIDVLVEFWVLIELAHAKPTIVP